MKKSSRRALAASLLVVAGCSDDLTGGAGGSAGGGGAAGDGGAGGGQEASPCGEIPDAPAFAIGTGEVCFEPLEDAEVVPRMYGPQNGFHVWVALVCADCPKDIIVTVGVKLEDGDDWVAPTSERVVTLKSAQIAGLRANLPGTSFTPEEELPEGTRVRMIAEARTLSGEPVHAGEKVVTLGEVEVWLNHCDPEPTTCGQPGGLKCCSS